ncbi:MAG TPA: LpqB family beta-propeller domain-containing protein [Pyrinomonadaceae bacterium]|jgi:Tol biopolymer transport system component/C-terminal processing protease CtpA/Prc|nr:LpqB family beta-propeller domain-containing protein [Pyrinomonadaceae bacterium]
MSFRQVFCAIVLSAFSALSAFAQARAYFTEPSLSPDRKEIAFVSGGDIWTVSATGGVASLLVSHTANEARPFYSPDGKFLAFISSRTGNGDIYLLTLGTGDLKRLTFDDGLDQLDGWSRDGRWIYFSSTSRDIGGLNDLYRVSVSGTPMAVSADRYTNEFFCSPSPDGKTLAFAARGIASGQWWRKGHSHIDESEIWLLRSFEDGTGTYERVTAAGGAKEMWPMWSADGRNLFYVSDRTDSGNKNGAQNIWTTTPGKSDARRLSNFSDGRVLWPSVSYDGREIVFEHNFAVWKLDTESGKASEVAITRRGASAGPGVERQRIGDQISELQLSPDGKKVAFVVRGEVFAASATDGGDAARVSNSVAEEYHLAWAPDSRRLAYVSDRDGVPHLFLYNFSSNSETQLTREAADDSTPRFSPDGKLIAFIRGAKELRVLDMAAKTERLVKTAIFERPPIISDRPFAWSPDGKWLAYVPIGDNQFKNVNVVSVDGTSSGPASYLANVFSNTVSWSPDGTYVLFDSGQRTESTQLARVDLVPRTPRFREDQFRDLFREETPRSVTPTNRPEQRPAETPSAAPAPTASPADEKRPASKPVQVVFDEIRRRLSFVPVGLDVNYQTISPDGKWVALIANAANQANLYLYSLDELSREPAVAKQLTSTSGSKSWAQFSPDNKEIFFIENGRIGVVNLEGRSRSLAVTAELDVEFSREKMEVFRQGWSYLRDFFYDSAFHGTNWEAVRAEYEPLIAGSRTPDEMRRLLQLMVGELNASHLGTGAPPGGNQPTTGRIGLRFDRREYESSGRLRVTDVIALGPVAIVGGIKPGDYLMAVDDRTIDQSTNLDELLNYKIGRRVSLDVSSTPDGAARYEVVVRPVNGATERGLLYRQWVERNRQYVAKASNGRLGYAHMFDMSTASLNQLHIDLDTENYGRDGVVIDIRNNSGGFVNVYAIDVLARRGYLTMTLRGLSGTSARTVLGQRSLNRPTILVTNQHSLSDAEDFTEGYRTLRLGQVVGEPTAGWIIFTWNQALIDGTTFRLPRMKITANDGANMERNPRPVDIEVTRPIGETLTDRDSQLDVAVRELLKQLGAARSTSPR